MKTKEAFKKVGEMLAHENYPNYKGWCKYYLKGKTVSFQIEVKEGCTATNLLDIHAAIRDILKQTGLSIRHNNLEYFGTRIIFYYTLGTLTNFREQSMEFYSIGLKKKLNEKV